MRCDQSPFPCHWWGTSIDGVPERPRVGTYGRYSYARLPQLPVRLTGDFGWLANASRHTGHIGREKARENQIALKALKHNANDMGGKLPGSFVRFMDTPSLQQTIRSTTDCFLDVCPALVRAPIGDGYLVRFMADSQSCIFWYLYMTAGGADHAVVSSPDFYGTPEEDWQEEAPDPGQIEFSEESFEAFLCRFWIENEICFSQYDQTPMTEAAEKYLVAYSGMGRS
jgi:hypothetical protein